MIAATTGTGIGRESSLILLLVSTMPIIAVVSAIMGVTALRSGLNRRRWWLAMGLLACPYAIALVFGGPELLGFIVQATFTGEFFGYLWCVPPPIIAVGLMVGLLVRRRELAQRPGT